MNVIDMDGKPKGRKRPGRAIPMKETEADEAVRMCALENSGRLLLEGVERLEELADQIAALRESVRTEMGRLKSDGYSVAAIKAVLRRRATTPEAIKAQEELALVVDTYLTALEVAQ